MARKSQNHKSKKVTVAANDPGLGFSPYRQSAAMTRTDSGQDIHQRGRKKAKAYSNGGWKREY